MLKIEKEGSGPCWPEILLSNLSLSHATRINILSPFLLCRRGQPLRGRAARIACDFEVRPDEACLLPAEARTVPW